MMNLSLRLVATTEPMADAFRRRFSAWPAVRVTLGRWEEMPPHDCFVTAGNSYGLMSAGIDAVVVSRFGVEIQEAVQLRILNDFLGEQPVGSAFLLETGDASVPSLRGTERHNALSSNLPSHLGERARFAVSTRASFTPT